MSKECLAHWHGFCCNSRQIGQLWGDSYLVEEEKRAAEEVDEERKWEKGWYSVFSRDAHVGTAGQRDGQTGTPGGWREMLVPRRCGGLQEPERHRVHEEAAEEMGSRIWSQIWRVTRSSRNK